MIPLTVIPAPGDDTGALIVGDGNAGSDGSGGSSLLWSGYLIVLSTLASGANGSGRPRSPPERPTGGEGEGRGETRLSGDVEGAEGAFAAGLGGTVFEGGSADVTNR